MRNEIPPANGNDKEGGEANKTPVKNPVSAVNQTNDQSANQSKQNASVHKSKKDKRQYVNILFKLIIHREEL